MTARGRPLDRLGDQGGLADARLALEIENGAGSIREAVEEAIDDRELTVASDHRLHPPVDAHLHERTPIVACPRSRARDRGSRSRYRASRRAASVAAARPGRGQ